MSGPFDSGYENRIDFAAQMPVTGSSDLPTGFIENAEIAYQSFRTEDLSVSKRVNMEGLVNEQMDKLYQISGDSRYSPMMTAVPGSAGATYRRSLDLLRSADKDIKRLQKENPDSGLMTAGELEDQVKEKAARLREEQAKISGRATGAGVLGQFAGTFAGAMTDPVNIATAPVALTTTSLPKLLLYGAGVGAAAELAIQPQVFQYKQELESPYTLTDAALNIGIATIAGGAFAGAPEALMRGARGVGQVYRRTADAIKKAKTVKPSEAMAGNILRDAADIMDARPARVDEAAHMTALGKARNDIANGVQARTDTITGFRQPEIEQIDPLTLRTDPEKFRARPPKDTGLREVDRWEPELSGTALVYEDATGARFVVDGHNRLELAKRAIDAGQPTDEVRMPGLVLKEADGFTVEQARAMGEAKNIAEGTDAATVERAKAKQAGRQSMEQVTKESLEAIKREPELVRRLTGQAETSDVSARRIADALRENRSAMAAMQKSIDSINQGSTVKQASKIFMDELRKDPGLKPGKAKPGKAAKVKPVKTETEPGKIPNLEDTDDSIMRTLLEAENTEINRILQENPDMEIPVDIRMNKDGEIEVIRKPATEVFAELDEQNQAVTDLITCLTGGLNAAS